ncbi:MAG: ABC transporter permease [Solirubrobacteraceae bacterium]
MPEPNAPLPGLPGLLARQLGYHARLLLRSPRAVVGGMLLPLLMLALRGHTAPAQQARLVAGLAVLGLLSTAYITHTAGLVAARESGVLKRWRATPLPPWCWFAGRIGATVLTAAAGAAVTVLAGAGLYGTHIHGGAIPSLAVALVLGAATWASIGTAASGLIPSVEAAWPLLGLTYLPVVVLSGGFGDVSAAPPWLAALVSYLPAEPVVHSAARALDGVASVSVHDLAVLLVWGGAGLLVSRRWFRWDS